MKPPSAIPTDGSDGAGLRDFLRVLRRRARIVALLAIIVPAVALAHAILSEKQYTATAKLLFRDPGFDQKLFGSTILAPSADPLRAAATNADLVSLDTVAVRAAAALNGRVSAADIRHKVSVIPEGQADIVSVEATDPNPSLAAQLANAIADQYVLFRRDSDRLKLTQAADAERQLLSNLTPGSPSSNRASVASRIEQLQFLAAIQTGNAEVVQSAQPPRSPSSPHPLRDCILGLIAGLALGVGVAVAMDRLDQRLRDATDAERILARPVLGTILENPALRLEEVIRLSGRESEPFRALRINLRYFAIDQEVKSLLITSTSPGDGKTTIATYLAATAAKSRVRVVLLEADLRRPVLRGRFTHLHDLGLTDVLTGQAPLSEVIQQLPVLPVAGAAEALELDVITAGSIPPNPTDLLESDRMGEVLVELERLYDLVIVDTSPVSIVPDAIPPMAHVSGVAIAIRLGRTTEGPVGEAKKATQLPSNIHPMGIIVNGASAEPDGQYGYYGYVEAQDLSSNGAGRGRRWRRQSERKSEAGSAW